MGTVSFFLLRVAVTGRRLTSQVRTDAIGVLRLTRAVLSTRTTFASSVAITARVGTTATTVNPCALFQNRSVAHCIYLVHLIYLSCGI